MAKAPNKPNQDEQDKRVDACQTLIAKGLLNGQIKRAMAKKFDMSPRSVERYVRRAREIMLVRSQISIEEQRAESRARYEQIIRDPKAHIRDRIRAQTRIDRLMGLEAPVQMEVFGTGGGPIEIEARHAHAVLDGLKQRPETAAALRLIAKQQSRALTTKTVTSKTKGGEA